ncbi:MAG: protoheme IX farnesyltransferase [Candidatus Hydrogenedentes bacterium]|nr:protoheme IX farnesyltransferase [Candidatus Hydrogenedentota bacterium]
MARTLLSAYVELTKPRILTMVLVTTCLGFTLGGGLQPYGLFFWTMLGTGCASGGAGALNHYLEREVDAKMARTQGRPLPSGQISPAYALLLGILLSAAGSGLLWYFANGLAAALALATVLLYACIYTPVKRVSWWNTPIGAIPGAIPPMIGWAAAKGELNIGAWVLFFILFLWQHPHFYAIAWMFREDYARGGFKMLPVVQPDGKNTFRQSLAAAIILIPVSLWPTFVQMSGWLYFTGALLCGFWFLSACVRWRLSGTTEDARKVLRVSVFYLPCILLLILVDHFFERVFLS